MADELERSEQEALRSRQDADRAARERAAKIMELQAESRRLVKRKQDEIDAKARQKYEASADKRRKDEELAKAEREPELHALDKTVRIQFPATQLSIWLERPEGSIVPPEVPLSSPLANALANQFGELEHLQFQLPSAGKKLKREMMALATFKTLRDAWQAVETGGEMRCTGLLQECFIGWANYTKMQRGTESEAKEKVYVEQSASAGTRITVSRGQGISVAFARQPPMPQERKVTRQQRRSCLMRHLCFSRRGLLQSLRGTDAAEAARCRSTVTSANRTVGTFSHTRRNPLYPAATVQQLHPEMAQLRVKSRLCIAVKVQRRLVRRSGLRASRTLPFPTFCVMLPATVVSLASFRPRWCGGGCSLVNTRCGSCLFGLGLVIRAIGVGGDLVVARCLLFCWFVDLGFGQVGGGEGDIVRLADLKDIQVDQLGIGSVDEEFRHDALGHARVGVYDVLCKLAAKLGHEHLTQHMQLFELGAWCSMNDGGERGEDADVGLARGRSSRAKRASSVSA